MPPGLRLPKEIYTCFAFRGPGLGAWLGPLRGFWLRERERGEGGLSSPRKRSRRARAPRCLPLVDDGRCCALRGRPLPPSLFRGSRGAPSLSQPDSGEEEPRGRRLNWGQRYKARGCPEPPRRRPSPCLPGARTRTMPRTTGTRLPLLLALLLFAPPPPPPPPLPGLLLLAAAAASGPPPARLGPPEQPPRRSLLEEEEEDAAGGRGFPPRVAKEAAKDLERAPVEMPSAPEEVLPGRAWAGEPQALLLLLPPPFLPREGRSPPPPPQRPASLLPPPPPPRRCVRLQESCVGQRLPCCDPCAACYCRFFNANCFCKRFGAPASSASAAAAAAAFPCGRN